MRDGLVEVIADGRAERPGQDERHPEQQHTRDPRTEIRERHVSPHVIVLILRISVTLRPLCSRYQSPHNEPAP